MSPRRRIGIAALLLFVASAVAFCVLLGGENRPTETSATRGAPADATPTNAVVAPERATSDLAAPARELAAPIVPEAAAPLPQQGFRGLVVDATNAPLAGVAVHLLASAANDPLALPWILQQRVPLAPLASARTAADGTFAIGLPVVEDKVHDLFFVDGLHAAFRLTNLRMQRDEWFDVGTLTMVPGVDVSGIVTIEGSGAPVPNAVVAIEAGASFVDAALRALPSGDGGFATKADTTGRFVLRNTPRLGVVRITASAPGFARVVRGNVNLSGNTPVEIVFALPAGLTVPGRVIDERGAAVPGARIAVWPKRRSDPPFLATSDHDGRFTVTNLAAGKYDVRIEARGFQNHERDDVVAGGDDLTITLTPNGAARLRVVQRNGATVRDFHVAVRRFLREAGDRLAFVADVPEQRVHLDAATEAVVIAGIPAGTFVAQVTTDGFAPTFSSPFELDAARRACDVEVVLTTGAALTGVVLDETGAPLADATVTTEADGAEPDSPTWRMLAAATPDRITTKTATTDANGRFALPLLTLGAYQLAIRHDDACHHRERGIRLDTEGERALAPIRLLRGALVMGRATFGGAIAPRMKIVLTSPSNPASRPGGGLRQETFTLADGSFRFPLRVPPGMYELRAAVVDTTDTPGGHFRQLRQLQRSAASFVLAAGLDRIERDIDLPNDH